MRSRGGRGPARREVTRTPATRRGIGVIVPGGSPRSPSRCRGDARSNALSSPRLAPARPVGTPSLAGREHDHVTSARSPCRRASSVHVERQRGGSGPKGRGHVDRTRAHSPPSTPSPGVALQVTEHRERERPGLKRRVATPYLSLVTAAMPAATSSRGTSANRFVLRDAAHAAVDVSRGSSMCP